MHIAFNIFKILINITNIFIYICVYTSHIGLNDNTAEYTISLFLIVDETIQEESTSDIIFCRSLFKTNYRSLFVTNGNVKSQAYTVYNFISRVCIHFKHS